MLMLKSKYFLFFFFRVHSDGGTDVWQGCCIWQKAFEATMNIGATMDDLLPSEYDFVWF